METLTAVMQELCMNCWGASLDLKNAYLHVPIHSLGRGWQGFCLENKVNHFNNLPFGLLTAPRMFTRVVKTIAEHLRMRWLVVDSPIARGAAERGKGNYPAYQLHRPDQQWNLTPSQQITFLGMTLNFTKSSAFLTPNRVADIVSCTLCLLQVEKAPPVCGCVF